MNNDAFTRKTNRLQREPLNWKPVAATVEAPRRASRLAMCSFRCPRGRATAMPAPRLPSIAMPLANGSPYLTIQIRRARLAKPFRILSLYPQCLPDANSGAGLYP